MTATRLNVPFFCILICLFIGNSISVVDAKPRKKKIGDKATQAFEKQVTGNKFTVDQKIELAERFEDMSAATVRGLAKIYEKIDNKDRSTDQSIKLFD